MTALVILLSVAVLLVTAAACAGRLLAARRRTRRPLTAPARALYNRYLRDVEVLTSVYLLQAPSDEEWLATAKEAAAKRSALASAALGPAVLEKPARDPRPALAHRLTGRSQPSRSARERAPARRPRARVLLTGLAVLAAGSIAGAAYLFPGVVGGGQVGYRPPLAPVAFSVSAEVSSLAYTYSYDKNGEVLAVGDAAGDVMLWSSATQTPVATLTDPVSSRGAADSRVVAVSFSPDGRRLATSTGHDVSLWDRSGLTYKYLAGLAPASAFVDALAYSRDGKLLAVGGADGSLTLWDMPAGKKAGTYTLAGASRSGVSSVAFSPDGKLLAAGSGNSVALWNLATGHLAATFRGGSSVAFSPDGKLLAVGSGNSVTLWNLATRTAAATFTDPASGHVSSVVFSPGGTALAATFGNGTTYLWDTATGRLAATLPGDSSVAFSPDGGQLAIGEGNSVTLWNINAQAAAATSGDPADGEASAVALSLGGLAPAIAHIRTRRWPHTPS